ncbi:MAG: cupin-like domain-containing protein [Verrucomicrobiales bacterium]|nr:cupin-like domain-containing protein [Verrucomicrobiales bacterium]
MDPAPSLSTQKVLQLERRRGLSYRQFIEEHAIPRRPVVLEDAIKDWPALKKWSPDFFRTRYGTRQVTIDRKTHSLAEIIDLAERSTPDNPAPYYRNIVVHEAYPELLSDLSPMPDCCTPNWYHSAGFVLLRKLKLMMGGGDYELFIGGAGRSFPYLHFDAPGAHSFLSQVYGRKLLVLFSPQDTPFLYAKKGGNFFSSELNDLDRPDLTRFPLFPQATRIEAEVHAGDTLFIPCGWWHSARMLSFSITLGIDVANATNWDFVTDFMSKVAYRQKPILGRPYIAYVRAVGALKMWTESLGRKK